MNDFRRFRHIAPLARATLCVACVLLAAACERRKPPAASDSALRAGPATAPDAAMSARASASTWDSSAGPVLLVAGTSPAQAIVIPPDSANVAAGMSNIPRQASVSLLGRNGSVQSADLAALSDSTGCAVATLRATPPPRAWSFGFIGGVVAAVAVDSTASIPRADSASLVIAVTALASALPNDSAGRFAGLPFTVQGLWRFTSPSGSMVIVATLARQINQEATPLREQTLLVVERGPADTVLTTAFSQRSYGDEEKIESFDVVGAALLGPSHTPAILISRDFGDAVAEELLEQVGGRWQLRWSSPRRHC